MNRYVMIRRLRGPAFLLLIGVLALMHQAHIIGSFWHLFWPLALILVGVIMLAERAALAADGGVPFMPFSSGASYPGPGAPTPPIDPRAGTGIPPYPGQPTAIVPAHEYDKDLNGGQS
jgi:hypothetical protein